MSAGSIVVDLLLKTGSWEHDTKRAEKRMAELKKEVVAAGTAIGAAFAGVAVAAAYMVKSSINGADEMGKLAQKVGTSVESLSALAYAADLAGVGQEELGAGLIKLTKNMSDAAMGTGEAIKGFTALGIAVKNSDGTLKSSDQVLTEIADKFAGFKDGAEKTALAVNLFGRSGAQLIPLLNEGAAGLEKTRQEAERLGIVLGTSTSKEAELFNDNLTRMSAAVRGVANRVAAELLPTLAPLSSQFVELAKNQTSVSVASDVMKYSLGGLVNLFQVVAVVGSNVGFVFLTLGRSIGAVVDIIGSLNLKMSDFGSPSGVLAGIARSVAGSGVGQIKGILDDLSTASAKSRAELDKFQSTVMALNAPSSGASGRGDPRQFDPRFKKTNAPALRGDPKEAKDSEFDRYLENLQKQLEKTQDLTTVEQVLTDIQLGRIKKLTDAEGARLLGLAGQVDDAKAQIELAKKADEELKKLREWEAKASEEEERRKKQARENLQAFNADMDDYLARLRMEIDGLQLEVDWMDKSAIEVAKLTAARRIQLSLDERINDAKRAGIELSAEQIKAWQAEADAAKQRIAAIIEEGDRKNKDPWRAAQESLRRYTEAANDSAEQITGVMENAFQGLEDAFVKFTMTGKLSFRDLANSILADLARIAARKAVSSLANGLMSALPGLIGAFTGGLSTSTAVPIANAIGGDGIGNLYDLTNNFGGGKATGGPVSGGTTYLVGERGPEMFKPNTSGTIIPNGAMGGGVMQVTIVNNMGGKAEATARETNNGGVRGVEVMFNEIDAMMARKIRRGEGQTNAAAQDVWGVGRRGN